jgi:hypothetical protein
MEKTHAETRRDAEVIALAARRQRNGLLRDLCDLRVT